MATLPDGSAGDIEVDELERSCGLDDELSIALVHHAAALESGVGVAAVHGVHSIHWQGQVLQTGIESCRYIFLTPHS